jgi:ubiquinone/menaquinone biosynthesis C-methylase UbiE
MKNEALLHSSQPEGANLLEEDLFPLPQSDARIFATREIIEDGIQGVGDQFRSGAETYDERYLQVDSKVTVISQAFDAIGIKLSQATTALDIGCGSGNGTFALLQMLPALHVMATDLSPEMVTLLARRADQNGLRSRITPFVANASNLKLKREAFDVIIGSSMLHHLLEPAVFLDTILRSVRPGGVCIFTEPFQAGHLVLRQLLAQLVQLAEIKGGVEPRHLQFFKDYIFTIDTMFRTDRENPVFAQLDDKWMFPRAMFSDAAKRAGMRHVIFGRHASNQIFLFRIKELVRLGLGESIEVPDWMSATIGETDRLISESLSEELLLEGCIVFAR